MRLMSPEFFGAPIILYSVGDSQDMNQWSALVAYVKIKGTFWNAEFGGKFR